MTTQVVTAAQVLAAQLFVQLQREDGETPDDAHALVAISEAQPVVDLLPAAHQEPEQGWMDEHGKIVTTGGDTVGGIGQVYVDATGVPSWVTVKTGLFGTAETFVPIGAARLDGHDFVVSYDKDTINAAPRVEVDGRVSPEEEQELYRYYGLTGTTDATAGRVDQGSRGAATSWPAISEEEHEVVLHEEVPVVDEKPFVVERVRLGTETVTDAETISAELRKQQIEVDDSSTESTSRTEGTKPSR